MLVLLLDREQTPVRQNGDRQAGGIGDAAQVEIACFGRLEGSNADGRHPKSPIPATGTLS